MLVLRSGRGRWPIAIFSSHRACVQVALLAVAAAAPAWAQTARRSRASPADTGTLEVVPGDSAALRGMLPNGLRFVVRENRVPRHRAELRLVINAGSVLEDEDQLGLAHFVEHMAFNGTAHFPKSALVDYLQSVGLRFGADLNAETGTDETIYRLTVPTDSAHVLVRAIEILSEWAHAVTFDSSEVVAERGVILAEWRLRTNGGTDPSVRRSAALDTLLYAGTRYPDRPPIGVPALIQAVEPPPLKRFYHDWYRPDLMAVVAVGDFDRRAVVERIRSEFGTLQNPSDERARPARGLPRWHGPLVAVLTDSSVGGIAERLMFRVPVDSDTTAAQWLATATRHDILRNMLLNILWRRLLISDSTANGVYQPFADSGCLLNGGADFCLELGGGVSPEHTTSGLTALETELAEIARHGPTPDEFDWARSKLRSDLATADLGDATKSSATWAAEYVNFAFIPVRYTAPALNEQETLALLPTLRPSDLAEFARACCTLPNLAVILFAPAAEASHLPDRARIVALLDSVQHATIPLHAGTSSTAQLFLARPASGHVTRQRSLATVGVTEWMLSNGMRVLFKPTRFAGEELHLRAIAPGGVSLAPDSLWPAAAVAGDVVSQALGWTDFSPATLRQRLFGDFIAGPPAVRISATEARVDVAGSPRHADLLFQLLHLAFQAPRADLDAFATWQAQVAARREQAPPDLLPDLLNAALTGDNPRAGPPTASAVRRIQLDQVSQFYQARFNDASHFTVIIVGALTPAQARPLVERYLAGLPTRHEGPEQPRSLGVHLATGVVRRAYRGLDADQALTLLAFPGEWTRWTPETQNELNALLASLQRSLTAELRERQRAVYAVQVGLSTQLADSATYVVTIQFASTPERAGELADAALAEIRRLQDGDVSPALAAGVAETTRRVTESSYAQNSAWLDRLTARVERGWPLDEAPAVNVHASYYTPQGIAAAARRYLDLHRYAQLTLLPRADTSSGAGEH